MKGAYPKGKGNKQQYVGDYPPHQMRGDYPPHQMREDYPPQMKGFNSFGAQQKGKHNGEETPQNMGVERKMLGQMRTAAKAFENLPGYEERLE
eukprot:12368677-Heterocapsa_arctica.AAC.1